MNIQIEDFKTGWFGITIGVKKSEIDTLIAGLENLKKDSGHFHIRSGYSGEGGVGEVEVYLEDDDASDNSKIDLSIPIYQNK